MRLDEFESQMQRLQMVYGERIYPEERKKIYWDMFKSEDASIFERVISKMIAEMHTAPPASKIKDAMRDSQQGRRPYENKQAEYAFKCEPCRDFGFGFIGDVIVACVCDRGRGISPAELAFQQGCYDRGRKFLRKDFVPGPATRPLPYDPTERIS